MFPSVRNSTKKVQKSLNRSGHIDNNRLATCWFEVSQLFAARAAPSQDEFWTTFAVVFNQSGLSDSAPVDQVILRERWEKIRVDTIEFAKYYQEVKPRYQESEKALVGLAMDRFAESQGYEFGFHYLWETQLRYRDDWMAEEETGDEWEDESDGSRPDSSVEVRAGGRMDKIDPSLNARPHDGQAGAGKLPAVETAGDGGPDSIEQLQLVLQALTDRLESNAAGISGIKPAAAKTPSAQASNKNIPARPAHDTLLINQTAKSIDKMYEENDKECNRIDQARLALEQDQIDIDIINTDLALLPDDEARLYYRAKKEAILAALIQAQPIRNPASSVPASSSW
ncbi:uncharacterized protein PGTG_09544 [Puccinia graminis f. sp. tritici CRL 75-36-700-3]|uniref:No apical meristem-associated C-terminal domain-containing protein n=1 Tax=Puccinia graminis f. sp. tritici (strain CRL 75-36-700-3 / race SCCL) TaxID=418459 RepID=E3KHQ6_PUCGT|nr:uncharacterized protein PGTG_09544 [Puccinia graminis f. sp. tritici CRL 75-36-700-3]EFP83831.1 hypothetical protein PGTG_09544 [Puccinia graminis f. sp. tritici CRL 75-36-700-3]